MVKMPNLGSATGRIRPALSRDTASVISPEKVQKANTGANLKAPPLAIQVMPPKKKKTAAMTAMHKGVAKAMLAGY